MTTHERCDTTHHACEYLAHRLGTLPPGAYLTKSHAETFLQDHGVSRQQARDLLMAEDGRRWALRQVQGRGNPVAIFPMNDALNSGSDLRRPDVEPPPEPDPAQTQQQDGCLVCRQPLEGPRSGARHCAYCATIDTRT